MQPKSQLEELPELQFLLPFVELLSFLTTLIPKSFFIRERESERSLPLRSHYIEPILLQPINQLGKLLL